MKRKNQPKSSATCAFRKPSEDAPSRVRATRRPRQCAASYAHCLDKYKDAHYAIFPLPRTQAARHISARGIRELSMGYETGRPAEAFGS